MAWLKRIQNTDGGWGEGGESYALDYKGYEPAPSTASQTAWALLGLMASGEVDAPEVVRAFAIWPKRKRGMGFGQKSASPRPDFRGSFTCAITAIRSSSRCGRWRVIAI